jgi:hypothetical protein
MSTGTEKAKLWGRAAAHNLLTAVAEITNGLTDDAVGAKYLFEAVQGRISTAAEQLTRARLLLEDEIQAQRQSADAPQSSDSGEANE